MLAMLAISAEARDLKEKSVKLRKGGLIPAVYYGAGKSSTAITVKAGEFKKVWRSAGESTTVLVKTKDDNIDALIHEVQLDPVSDEPIHVDFLAIDMTKKIKVKVPLEYLGVSEVVKSGLGNLVKVLHEVEVEALPKDLPHSLHVDISKLKTLEDNIAVKDIKLPEGVSVMNAPEEIVASVVAQVEEKFEEAPPPDLSQIEVSEERGKKIEEAPTPEGVGVPTESVGSEKAPKKEKK